MLRIPKGKAVWRNDVPVSFPGLRLDTSLCCQSRLSSYPSWGWGLASGRKEWEVDVIQQGLEKYLRKLCPCALFTDMPNCLLEWIYSKLQGKSLNGYWQNPKVFTCGLRRYLICSCICKGVQNLHCGNQRNTKSNGGVKAVGALSA